MDTLDYWIRKAIKKCGEKCGRPKQGRKELLRLTGFKSWKISHLLTYAKKISLDDAFKIGKATDGLVTRFHMLDHLDPITKQLVEEELKTTNELRLSDKTAMAIAYKKEIGERRGRPFLDREICPTDKLKGRTDEIVAKRYGFRSKDEYRQVEQVVTSGTGELIAAMDSQQIRISEAAKLAFLPAEEQRRILQLSTKEIKTYIKQICPVDDSSLTLFIKENCTKVSSQFWTTTAKKIMHLSLATEAGYIAFYLQTCPSANMLGVYNLPIHLIAEGTGISLDITAKALHALCQMGFCSYDEQSEYVWIHEMACHQVGTQLKPSDHRIKSINEAYQALPNLIFLRSFFDKYHAMFHLEQPREYQNPMSPYKMN